MAVSEIITGLFQKKVLYENSPDKINFKLAHAWLKETYWCKGISLEKVEKGFRESTTVVSAHSGNRMVGIARCVSDTTRFGYIADVYVEESARGKGIARAMVRNLISQPSLRDVEHWYLFTKDAHGVYRDIGFRTYDKPERLMHFAATKK